MSQKVIIIGGGGHARVLLDILSLHNFTVVGFTDPSSKSDLGVEYLGDDDKIHRHDCRATLLVNGIGSVGLPQKRREVFERFKTHGFHFASVIHPRAVVARDVQIGEGVQIMAGAVVNPGAQLGVNVIVNTGAVVDHDGMIGPHTHIAPGVTISGGVTIGEGSHIATGAVIIQGLQIGSDVLVGAGAVVVHNILSGQKVIGIPARAV